MAVDLGNLFGTLTHVVGAYTSNLATYWPGNYLDPGTTIYYNYWDGSSFHQLPMNPPHPEFLLPDSGYPFPIFPAPQEQLIMSAGDSTFNHGVSCELHSYVTFPYPVTVTSVGAQFQASGGDQGSVSTYKAFLYYSGAWHQVDTVVNSASPSATWQNNSPYTPRIVTGTWNNVTVADIYGSVVGVADFFLQQIAILGVPYSDSGLRVKTPGGIVSIGSVPLSQTFFPNVLRIKKSSGVVTVPLVATSDPTASSVRMRRGGVTYSLPKLG